MKPIPIEALRVMDERFGCDSLITLATCASGVPHARVVNAYYESGAFYVITHALSGKMRQITENPTVAICGEWFTAHGQAVSLGHILSPRNSEIADKLRTVFAEWYFNGHTDEADPNTIILRVRITDGVLFSHGVRYDLDFGPR